MGQAGDQGDSVLCLLNGEGRAAPPLTQHLAMELAEHGIRVNAVSPAVVETPIYGEFIKPEEIHTALAGFNAFHPISRVGTAADVGAVIDFLLSYAASWVTGAV